MIFANIHAAAAGIATARFAQRASALLGIRRTAMA